MDITAVDAALTGVNFTFEKDLEPDIDKSIIKEISPLEVHVPGMGVVCRHFMRGSCSRGHDCHFDHQKVERDTVCKHWLRGLCKKGDACEFLHVYDLTKMPDCFFYLRFGECQNPDCVYRHVSAEERVRECSWYARGFCKHGPNCKHKHVKKIPCANYLRGFCPNGLECEYGHPKYELPRDEAGGQRAGTRAPLICNRCGQVGHRGNACRTNPGAPGLEREGSANLRPMSEVKCFKCGEIGHYADSCRSIPGGPPYSKSGPVGPHRPGPSDLSQIRCYACQEMGHYASSCPQAGR